MKNLFCRVFHRQSWPQRDAAGAYLRCLDCGRRIPIDLAELSTLRDPRTHLHLPERGKMINMEERP